MSNQKPTPVIHDCDAWNRYPQHRWIFNKLELSLKLGYNAGPGGVSITWTEGMHYVVRPIYNLSGMGVNARIEHLQPGDFSTVKPGEFWCEYFHGNHISIDYSWDQINNNRVLRPVFAAQGLRTSPELYRFSAWQKIEPPMWPLPNWISKLHDVPEFNIEFVGGRIIEIHLRHSNDFPKGATSIIPIWDDMTTEECDMFARRGYTANMDFDDADGHLPCKRLGFFYR